MKKQWRAYLTWKNRSFRSPNLRVPRKGRWVFIVWRRWWRSDNTPLRRRLTVVARARTSFYVCLSHVERRRFALDFWENEYLLARVTETLRVKSDRFGSQTFPSQFSSLQVSLRSRCVFKFSLLFHFLSFVPFIQIRMDYIRVLMFYLSFSWASI